MILLKFDNDNVSTVFDLALRKEEKWQKLWAKKNNKWTWIGFEHFSFRGCSL